MSDLKTFWDNPGMPSSSDLGGDSITSSGSDPSITVDDPNGLTQVAWQNPSVPTPDGSESENSVSGLPSLPNRYQPSETPPEPPTLQDRNPGTIDQQ
jgi:hypothetical protein